MGTESTTPVRIDTGTVDRIRRLAENVRAFGWKILGTPRKDRVTLGNIVDEAINALEEKLDANTKAD